MAFLKISKSHFLSFYYRVITKVALVNFNANIDHSPEQRAEFIEWLTQVTVIALSQAENNASKLNAAVAQYLNTALAANLNAEEIENILGVNEPSIMDLAMLSEEDEEVVVDAFEEFINSKNLSS